MGLHHTVGDLKVTIKTTVILHNDSYFYFIIDSNK